MAVFKFVGEELRVNFYLDNFYLVLLNQQAVMLYIPLPLVHICLLKLLWCVTLFIFELLIFFLKNEVSV